MAGRIEAFARRAIVSGDLIGTPSEKLQFVAPHLQLTLQTDAAIDVLGQRAGRVVAPDHFASDRIQRDDVGTVVVRNAGGGVDNAVLDRDTTGDRPCRDEASVDGDPAPAARRDKTRASVRWRLPARRRDRRQSRRRDARFPVSADSRPDRRWRHSRSQTHLCQSL